ncbi:MAG: hypothetical protein WCF99_18065 [Chloroflexales bacterium]
MRDSPIGGAQSGRLTSRHGSLRLAFADAGGSGVGEGRRPAERPAGATSVARWGNLINRIVLR